MSIFKSFARSTLGNTTDRTLNTSLNDSKRMAILAFLYLFIFAAIAIFFIIIYAWGEALNIADKKTVSPEIIANDDVVKNWKKDNNIQ